MKLWDKGVQVNSQIEAFTVGKDREFDLLLAEADVYGNIAHAQMLESIGLLTKNELIDLKKELKNILSIIRNNKFKINEGTEDVHSQVEFLLCEKLGDTGKKIHSGRSRNDQVLVDIKIYLRKEIEKIVKDINVLFNTLLANSEKYKNEIIPGYTHLQVAMPSSFGLWFACYAESLSDDLLLLEAAFRIVNQNPLGSAAGYGSSFPLNRTMTTELLGFETMNFNVMNAQMSRGKAEKISAFALSSVAATLSKLAMEVCLFLNQNFGFISFPEELTTGSSIMPHKKNPDVFELIRAKCNKMQALSTEISFITTNLPFGYNRDLQIIKEILFPAFAELSSCINMAAMMFEQIVINKNIAKDEKYSYMYSVELVNKMVMEGVPFRDAYKKTGEIIRKGLYKAPEKLNHTHEGSIGNLCNDKIIEKFNQNLNRINFDEVNKKLKKLEKAD